MNYMLFAGGAGFLVSEIATISLSENCTGVALVQWRFFAIIATLRCVRIAKVIPRIALRSVLKVSPPHNVAD